MQNNSGEALSKPTEIAYYVQGDDSWCEDTAKKRLEKHLTAAGYTYIEYREVEIVYCIQSRKYARRLAAIGHKK